MRKSTNFVSFLKLFLIIFSIDLFFVLAIFELVIKVVVLVVLLLIIITIIIIIIIIIEFCKALQSRHVFLLKYKKNYIAPRAFYFLLYFFFENNIA